MNVLGDLVARERRSPRPALRVPAHGRSYTYREFCTTAYKAGNVLRYLGVRRGDRVEVAPDRLPEPVLTFLGAAQLGAVTSFHPRGEEARVVVVPREREGEFDLPPGSKLAVYGGAPADPTVTHWERDVWSENPAVHPSAVDPDDPALATAERTVGHRTLLAAAAGVVDDWTLDDDTTVAVRDSLAAPGVVVAGVIAPLLAGGTILFPSGDRDGDATGDVAVGAGLNQSPEARAIDPSGVL